MNKVVTISNQKDQSVREALDEALAKSDTFEGVIILAIKKDGSQWLTTSFMSGYQKSFLLAFFQALMTSWFKLSSD